MLAFGFKESELMIFVKFKIRIARQLLSYLTF